MYSIKSDSWLSDGNYDNTFDKALNKLGDLPVRPGDLSDWRWVSHDGYYFGVVDYRINDISFVRFVFSATLDKYHEGFVTMQQAAELVLLFAVFV